MRASERPPDSIAAATVAAGSGASTMVRRRGVGSTARSGAGVRTSAGVPASDSARTSAGVRTYAGASAPAGAPIPAGPLVLDRYRLRRRLGTGAFGSVWQATDERLRRDVAVKLLPRERIVGGRFAREARAAARLSHPGIVTLYEAAVDDDGAYLVSELVRGSTLARLLEDGRLSDRAIVRIGIALCDALAHAHAQGVVHRDIKPSNILVPRRPTTPDGIAKLTDFGVARLIGGNPLTRTGDVIGTAAYMAPEQAEGRPADAAADLYSLAIVTYEALTGVNPLAKAPRTRRLGTYLPPLRRQRRDLPRALGQAIDQALRPRPGERGTLEELREALERSINLVRDEPGVVSGPTRWRTTVPDREREPPPWRATPPQNEPDGQADPPARTHPPATPAPPAWASRALAGATSAALAAWLTTNLIPHPPLTPGASALAAALLTTALPRLGWLALAAATTTLLATQHRPGAALLMAIAMVAPAPVLFKAPTHWPLGAIAPGLGVVGLAGAWPALAGRAKTALRRAALGASGWLWLQLVAPLAHKSLYTKAPPRTWGHSVTATATHVLSPLLSGPQLAACLIWAFAAAVLPLVRGRRLAVVAVPAWAFLLTTAITIAGPTILPGMAVLGGIAGVVFTLAPDVTSRLRQPPPNGDLRSMESR